MYYSSKIKTKDSLYTNTGRCDSKDEYVESLIIELQALKQNGSWVNYTEMFADCMSVDTELREDGNDDVKWYENHLRKNFMRLDSITLVFLLNMLVLNNN